MQARSHASINCRGEQKHRRVRLQIRRCCDRAIQPQRARRPWRQQIRSVRRHLVVEIRALRKVSSARWNFPQRHSKRHSQRHSQRHFATYINRRVPSESCPATCQSLSRRHLHLVRRCITHFRQDQLQALAQTLTDDDPLDA